VFFTSGTTGAPKGVPISHENVLAYLRGIRSITEISADDRVMQVVDLTFDLSVHDIFLAWTSGACLISIPENGTLLSTRFVQEHRATHWLSVPSAAALVKQAGLLEPGTMPTLKYSFFCGEALTGAVAESWATAAPNSEVWNIYGPTEATVAFSARRYTPGQVPPPAVVSLGEPFPEQRMELFTDDALRVHDGIGEICLSGSQVTEGYWNAPELTAQRFFEADGRRWYRTGDLGRYVADEGYAYLGRADRQVKIRGYRVELQDVENSVREATNCDLVAVIPHPIDDNGAVLGCVAVAVGGQVGPKALERCRQLLPDYMVPTEIIQIAEMPLNANGKIDHRAVRDRVLARDR
jgi:amino acid adenylation domain-containing protein